jgi:hypothetical protein
VESLFQIPMELLMRNRPVSHGKRAIFLAWHE